VFVESESKKVGNVAVPDALIERMRASDCIALQLADDERVQLLLEDYDFFVRDPQLFCERLQALAELRGNAVVQAWQEDVAAGRIEQVVRELLLRHYDPGYAASIKRNFVRAGKPLDDGDGRSRGGTRASGLKLTRAAGRSAARCRSRVRRRRRRPGSAGTCARPWP
jgi:hypothetical protein